MSERIVVPGAEHCPFCGCLKMFLKAYTKGAYKKRFAVSVQCSKCHVNGPEALGPYRYEQPYFHALDAKERDDLIRQAVEKWNHRA